MFINLFFSEQGNNLKFLNLIAELENKLRKDNVQLNYFSLLFNSIKSLNFCVKKIGDIALYQRNLETFKIWMG